MIVLTPAESRELDQRTIDAGTPSATLMQRAVRGVMNYLLRNFDLGKHEIAVECGPGNNGQDGELLLALLRQAQFTLDPAQPTLIVDAVLGTGATGAARGRALEQIRHINASGATIVSIDVPSGLGSGEHVIAHHTLAIGTLKPVHVLPPFLDACGRVEVLDIGLLPASPKLHVLDPPAFPARGLDAHKGNFGHVLVVGGAAGKWGAAALCGLAALRAGAGWVTATVETPYPELMSAPLSPVPMQGKNVIAIGPGLGLDHVDMVRHLYATCPQPLVVDADALNSLAGWTLPAPPAPRILTPHPGEFSRLGAAAADRLESARQFATTHQVTLVLKGRRTLIAHADGRVYISPTGSPALAKAGSGDILTGLIAGFYAQDPRDAAVHAAVWLHGRCGELGAAQWTDRCLLPTDLLGYLPDAIRSAN